MADSKKKKTPAKRAAAPKAGPAKPSAKPVSKQKSAAAGSKTKVVAAAARSKPAASSPRAAAGAPRAKQTETPPLRQHRGAEETGASVRTAELERLLAEARRRIAEMEEEKDALALFEEAEPEVQKQLEEAQEEIRSLRAQLEQAHRAHPAVKGTGDDGEIEFDEDEEEEAPHSATEEIDDVEAIYDRLDDPRVRRRELDRERIDRESEAGDEPYWLVCPKCGDSLDEIESEDVKLDRCENCGGIYMDRGEVEMLLSLSRGREGLRRVRNVLTL